MSYIYHGTTNLVALPGRSVQTFPSGLVRVDRTYACRANLAERYRQELAVGNPLPLDDGTPAIDGLFIFPEPQEVERGDGFVEFKVSGYGRTAGIGAQGVLSNQGAFAKLTHFDFLSREYTLTRVLPTETPLSRIFEPPNIVPEREFIPKSSEFFRTGQIGIINDPRSEGFFWLAPQGTYLVKAIAEHATGFLFSVFYIARSGLQYLSHSSQNYGRFSEYVITYGQDTPVFVGFKFEV